MRFPPLSGNPYTLVTKDTWSASSSGHYSNAAKWDPKNMADTNQWTYYCSASAKMYHWLQIDFGKTIQVRLDLTLLPMKARLVFIFFLFPEHQESQPEKEV